MSWCNCKKGSTTRTGIVCSGSPSTPDTPSTPSTPDTPTTDTAKCYVKDHEYVWATTQPTGSGLVSSITTADKCRGCETGYAMNSSNKCVKPDSSPNGGNGSGGESNSESNDSNPQTGASSVIFVWMIGLMAIGYSVWYFKRSTNN